ncbi:Acyl-CoA dehydrogenase [Desulfatibacillum alkenivorans DSM 16219]|jgi:acyl-CoA dehydrogenase|uniref:Acyl-CoA dehydrogenase n=1 Tax=Desulfatibacillum alkenivorans DSM 16219 TaxID=1121393 RepID=A0A1M6ELL8_9BACT|nr:acyl-CoA dehydrogenase family protein [Desulfatibacillum alkenivorans]SHI86289.1 Acyl-CoA dehydrogenase [Desulfatibacillum alkenivorans DSM 16219]
MDYGFSKEQEMIRKEMARFCKKELSREYVAWMDENVDFPPGELWEKFREIGIFQAYIPEEYGGEAISVLDSMISYEEICKASMSVALAVGASIGFGARFIGELGSKEQKEKYLPLLGEGKAKMCMALTEPAGGTDILGAISTTAEEKEGRWVINGEKVFITGAHASDYMITICRTQMDAKPSESLSIFLVPSNSEGITITRIPKISCHHCDSVGITFSNVEIPTENLIGTRNGGWYEMLTVLNPERIGCAVMGVGLMAAAYEDAFQYAQQRHAFGGPISRFQILQHYLADMYINLENARNLTYKAAWLCDQGKPYHLEATMAKLVASEGALHAGRFGAEIMGGYGICMEYPMQRYLRDAYQLQFSPISNEMSKNMLMQFQGLPKSWA